jgi:NADH-quinone oxidoreductase subunit L
MYWVGTATAAVTAFYVSRAMFMTFFGEFRGHGHPHESPATMWAPLAVLAVLSLGGGYWNVPHFLDPVFPAAHEEHNLVLVAISVAAGLGGIAFAWFVYVARPGLPASIAASLGGLYRLVYDKYRIDELYAAVIVSPLVNGSRSLLWRLGDVWLIDGMVNGAGSVARSVGGALRHLQSGNIRHYAAWVVTGSVLAIFAAGLMGAAGGFGGGIR